MIVEHLNLVNALPQDLARQARHVVTENQRVLDGVRALRNNDLKTLGKLLTASHQSLRSDYEISSLELDLLVDLVTSVSEALDSRRSGVGIGGSTISLVVLDALEELKKKVSFEYPKKMGIALKIYTFKASAAARILPLQGGS